MLFVDGSAGLDRRLIAIPTFHPFQFEMMSPPHNVVPWNFVVFGKVGTPVATDQTVLPMMWGTMCFPPTFMAPTDPTLFVLTPGVLPNAPTPWVYSAPFGLPIPIEFTLQGVAWTSTADVSVTNGLIVEIF